MAFLQAATRNFSLLFFGCLLFHLAGTWTLPLVDRDEPRFAEASREMIERGDYIIPYFNNQYRFDKPPLTYWFQVVSYRLFGQTDFAARFPTAVAASLTALIIFAWGRRIESVRLGLWAAIVFTLCLQTILHAKAAVADMWLVLFVTLAHWAGYELLRDLLGSKQPGAALNADDGRKWWWIFYLALAFAFLAKGPAGWVPLGTIAATRFFLPQEKLNRRFLFVAGYVVVLAIIALWGIPAVYSTHGKFLWVGIVRQVLGRTVGTMQGHGGTSILSALATLPFYFVTIFVSFFPWSIKLPWLTRRLWKDRDAIDSYLIAGTGVIFVLFTIVKTKLPHYILPAFPLLSLLLVRHWFAAGLSQRRLRNWAIAMGSVCFAIALIAPPLLAPLFPSVELFKKSRDALKPEMDFGSVAYEEPTLVWYFRSRVHGYLYHNRVNNRDALPLQPRQVKAFLEKPGAHFVIMPTALANQLYPTLPEGWQKFSTRGIHFSKGRQVDLTLILKRS